MIRRVVSALVVALILTAGLGLWLTHPVCVPLTPDDVTNAARYQPLEQRRDRQWHGPVFQHRNGRWFQCKSWISRQLFF
jgi:hypothetical protein